MLAGIFHEGSGLGDQLFRYITVRTLADEKGFEYGMMGQFKGDFFLKQPHIVENALMPFWSEKIVREDGIDIRSYDPEINFVRDDTLIDGSFEDDKYWGNNIFNISKWLAVEPLNVPDDLCVIGFRGGEYYTDLNLGLPKEYFFEAVKKMQETNPNMKFEVHTDDPVLAKQFFPDFKVIENTRESHSKHSNMGFNWRAMRYAKYAIIANSSFYILPRLLAHNYSFVLRLPLRGYEIDIHQCVTIAPRYWARHNTRVWARPACYYRQFTYL